MIRPSTGARVARALRSRLVRRAHLFALAWALTLLGALTGAPASAAGLFAAVSAAEANAAATADLPLAAVRSRVVRLDLGELSRHVTPPGNDLRQDRVARARSLDGVIRIELFPDAAATFRRTDVDTVGDSGITWTGKISGRRYSFAALVIESGEVTGAVQLGSRYFRIDPVGGGLHRVTEIDRSRLPHNENDYVVPENLPPPSPDERSIVEPRAKTVVTVLGAYTQKAKNQSANVVNEIKLALQMANTAYANTGIKIRLKLVGTMKTGAYNEGADTFNQWLKVLNDVSGFNNPATLSSVRTKRNQLDADLVALIVRKSSTLCGLAWIIVSPSAATSDYGFSEHALDCLAGGIVFPHELGHNMGLHHDRLTYRTETDPDRPNPPKSKYNFGFINNNAGVIDIMAYLNSCAALPCIQVQWFSSASVKYNGAVKFGIPKGTKNAADATRRLNETRTGIAAYR